MYNQKFPMYFLNPTTFEKFQNEATPASPAGIPADGST